MFDSVRTRLTLWYAAVLALSLIAFAFIVYYAAASIFYERQDESLRSTAQTVASAYLEELEEVQSVAKASDVVLRELVFPSRYVEVTDDNGKAIAWSGNFSGNGLTIPATVLLNSRERGIGYVSMNGLRVAVVPLSSNRQLGFAAVAEPLSVIDEGLRRLRLYFFAGVPLILLLASLGGYFLARKSLAPIDLMNRQTQRITAESLSLRLEVPNPRDEPGRLGATINGLLARLEESFKQQQRFIADASHELRTPLAVLRGETEVALEKERGPDDYRQSLSLIKDEAERLSRIVEDLFILAQQPIDAPTLMNERIVLNEIVADCVRAAQVLAARKAVRLSANGGAQPLTLRGDDELLKRMLLNLLDNAVKYTPEGGEISVELTGLDGKARIVVRDTGQGIPEKDQPHIFDRFYRVDTARSRALGGAGLGLSIAHMIVKAHGGEIGVASAPGRGSVFTVELPLRG
jgi:two-component system, OmpR family, heavy metal sensor histidine kinase CusS